MNNARISKLQAELQQRNLDLLILIPGNSLYYLSGLSFHLMERPTVCFFSATEQPLMILPELEQSKAEAGPVDITLISYTEDMESRMRAFSEANTRLNLSEKRIGIEPMNLRTFEEWLLQAAAPGVSFVAADDVVGSLRIIKDTREVGYMRKAAQIAEEAMRQTLPQIRLGMTEKELAAELVVQLLRAGSEPELAFSPAVASGPNSALPHAAPSERKLQAGDLLLFDWGARFMGYCSDITRTFALGDIDPKLRKIYDVVKNANQAGHQAARPGVSGEVIDTATRKIIEAAGYGKEFFHRTGHGLGLDAHETPYIAAGESCPLAAGMTFTIEPGIYIHGLGGVRIEDDVVMTTDGSESLSTLSREFKVIL